MKVFLCSIALCLIASAFGNSKNLGEICTTNDKCPDNASCMRKNIFCDMMCHCSMGYAMKGPKCLKTPGQACAADADCVEGTCSEKKCKCPDEHSWSKKAMKCVKGVVYDIACDETKDSTKCTVGNTEYKANLMCKSNKCACKDDYQKMNDHDDLCVKKKQVGKKYDEACTKDEDCDAHYANLKCKNSKCGCDTGFGKKTIDYTDDQGKVTTMDKCISSSATMATKPDEDCKVYNDAKTGPEFGATAKYCPKDHWCGMCKKTGTSKCLGKKDNETGEASQVTFGILVTIGCVALRKLIV